MFMSHNSVCRNRCWSVYSKTKNPWQFYRSCAGFPPEQTNFNVPNTHRKQSRPTNTWHLTFCCWMDMETVTVVFLPTHLPSCEKVNNSSPQQHLHPLADYHQPRGSCPPARSTVVQLLNTSPDLFVAKKTQADIQGFKTERRLDRVNVPDVIMLAG